MVKIIQNIIVVLVLVGLSSGVVQASVFVDPTSMFNVKIPDNWVYQAYESDGFLTVFYGEDNPDLLYFERLIQVSDASAMDFARRTLRLYGESGGLKNLTFNDSFRYLEVDGEEGVWCTYTYQNQSGKDLWEERIFFVFSDKQAFTLTLGGTGKWENRDQTVLEDILTEWRWLF